MRHSGCKPKLSEFKINSASRSCPTKQPKYAQTGDWQDCLWGSRMEFPLMFWQHAYAELFSLLTRTCRFSAQKVASFSSRPPHLCGTLTRHCHQQMELTTWLQDCCSTECRAHPMAPGAPPSLPLGVQETHITRKTHTTRKLKELSAHSDSFSRHQSTNQLPNPVHSILTQSPRTQKGGVLCVYCHYTKTLWGGRHS